MLSKQILSRFSFNDPVLIFLKNFDPAVATSGTCESLIPLTGRFPQMIGTGNLELERLNTEWRELPHTPQILKHVHLPFEKFWSFVFNLRNELDEFMYPKLTNFLKGIFALPHSSAAAERVFSQLTLIKTKKPE